LLLIAVVIVGISVDSVIGYKCPVRKCVSAGDSCEEPDDGSYFPECKDGSYCETVTEVCNPKVAIGEACDDDSACADDDAVCFYDTCQKVQKTQKEGEACDVLHDCFNNSLYCGLDAVCRKYSLLGEACNNDFDAAIYCYASYTCHNGKCIPLYSLQYGEGCSDTIDGCAPSLSCISPNQTEEVYVCLPTKPASNKPCNLDTDCNPYETCDCSANAEESTCLAPETVNSDFATDIVSLYNCLLKSNCQDVAPKCCGDEWCSAYKSSNTTWEDACQANPFEFCSH
jgi:hypothetical protein